MCRLLFLGSCFHSPEIFLSTCPVGLEQNGAMRHHVSHFKPIRFYYGSPTTAIPVQANSFCSLKNPLLKHLTSIVECVGPLLGQTVWKMRIDDGQIGNMCGGQEGDVGKELEWRSEHVGVRERALASPTSPFSSYPIRSSFGERECVVQSEHAGRLLPRHLHTILPLITCLPPLRDEHQLCAARITNTHRIKHLPSLSHSRTLHEEHPDDTRWNTTLNHTPVNPIGEDEGVLVGCTHTLDVNTPLVIRLCELFLREGVSQLEGARTGQPACMRQRHADGEHTDGTCLDTRGTLFAASYLCTEWFHFSHIDNYERYRVEPRQERFI